MKHFLKTASTFALALAVTTASAKVIVTDVAVETDLSAVSNANALDFWPNLSTDLQKAIGEELIPYAGEDGYMINVSIDDISLDGSYLLGNDGEFNRLAGWVRIYDDDGMVDAFEVALSAYAETPAVPDNTVILLPSEEGFYTALIDAFADEVGDRIEEIEL